MKENIEFQNLAIPSWELFEEQDQAYRDSMLLPDVKSRLAVEAGISLGRQRWVGDYGRVLGLNQYGASVASFFVSRVDTNIDPRLQELIGTGGIQSQKAQALLGGAAIANARLAYADYKRIFTSERFQALNGRGAHIQSPLWASTSTKNPNYRDVIYVEELIGPDTVNTVPPQTLTAFLDHGKVRLSLELQPFPSFSSSLGRT